MNSVPRTSVVVEIISVNSLSVYAMLVNVKGWTQLPECAQSVLAKASRVYPPSDTSLNNSYTSLSPHLTSPPQDVGGEPWRARATQCAVCLGT